MNKEETMTELSRRLVEISNPANNKTLEHIAKYLGNYYGLDNNFPLRFYIYAIRSNKDQCTKDVQVEFDFNLEVPKGEIIPGGEIVFNEHGFCSFSLFVNEEHKKRIPNYQMILRGIFSSLF